MVDYHAAATDAVGAAGKEALPNLSAAAARAQDTHHAVVAFAGYGVVIAGGDAPHLDALVQPRLVAGHIRAWPHVFVPLHIQWALVVFAAAVAGIDFRHRGKGGVVGIPVFAAAARLVSHMVRHRDGPRACQHVPQFAVGTRLGKKPVGIGEKHIVVPVRAVALPFIAGEHGPALGFGAFG